MQWTTLPITSETTKLPTNMTHDELNEALEALLHSLKELRYQMDDNLNTLVDIINKNVWPKK